MAGFTINNEASQGNIGAAFKTQMSVFSSATPKRIKIYEWIIGVNGSPPADTELEIDFIRMTVDGTSTASVTPGQLDPADSVALSTAKLNYTVEPTASGVMYYTPFNQRATVRWLCSPGSELITPATTANGFANRVRAAAYASTVGITHMFTEG